MTTSIQYVTKETLEQMKAELQHLRGLRILAFAAQHGSEFELIEQPLELVAVLADAACGHLGAEYGRQQRATPLPQVGRQHRVALARHLHAPYVQLAHRPHRQLHRHLRRHHRVAR